MYISYIYLGSQGGGGYEGLESASSAFANMNFNHQHNNSNNQQQQQQHLNPTGDSSYYARTWGSHPDMIPYDVRSQNSTTASTNASLSGNSMSGSTFTTTTGGGGGGTSSHYHRGTASGSSGKNSKYNSSADSRHDSRYQFDNISLDGSVNSSLQ